MIVGIGAGSAMISRVPGARRRDLALAGRLFAQSERSVPAAWLTMRAAWAVSEPKGAGGMERRAGPRRRAGDRA